MILSQLGAYLAERRCVSLRDLEYRFEIDADALRGMLGHWQRKGRLRRLDAGSRCGGCSGCDHAPEMYEWIAAPKVAPKARCDSGHDPKNR